MSNALRHARVIHEAATYHNKLARVEKYVPDSEAFAFEHNTYAVLLDGMQALARHRPHVMDERMCGVCSQKFPCEEALVYAAFEKVVEEASE